MKTVRPKSSPKVISMGVIASTSDHFEWQEGLRVVFSYSNRKLDNAVLNYIVKSGRRHHTEANFTRKSLSLKLLKQLKLELLIEVQFSGALFKLKVGCPKGCSEL